jgi:hypothetical protein
MARCGQRGVAEAVSRARSRPSVFDKMLDGKDGKEPK